MIKITVNGNTYEKEAPVVLEDLANEFKQNAYCATVNNRIHELTYELNINFKSNIQQFEPNPIKRGKLDLTKRAPDYFL